MQISKSDYMLFLRHPAWLWLKKHAKHLLPPIDPALQARFDEGHAFEPYAEALFPDVVRLGFSDFAGYQTLTSRTLEAWESGASPNYSSCRLNWLAGMDQAVGIAYDFGV